MEYKRSYLTRRIILVAVAVSMLLAISASCGKSRYERLSESRSESLVESARERTKGTFGANSGDMWLVATIPEDDSVSNCWNEILDAVDEYRNSPEYADDDRDTRCERVWEILSEFEGEYIVEGSLTEHPEYISGGMILGGSFQIMITDPEWYLLHN